jgi:predicted XRE-type DNA-binding protein
MTEEYAEKMRIKYMRLALNVKGLSAYELDQVAFLMCVCDASIKHVQKTKIQHFSVEDIKEILGFLGSTEPAFSFVEDWPEERITQVAEVLYKNLVRRSNITVMIGAFVITTICLLISRLCGC